MNTVGQVLKKARKERGVSLKEASLSTRIQLKYLRALEEDKFSQLPSLTSSQGFIKNYAQFLEIPTAGVLAIFRRDFYQSEKGKIIPTGMINPVNEIKFRWSPKVTLLLVMTVLLLSLFGYLGYQYFSFNNRPPLEIISPKEKETVFTDKIEILGKSRPDSLVTVNGNLVMLSSQGEFRYQLELFPGDNKFVVEAKSKLGRKTRLERTVFRYDAER